MSDNLFSGLPSATTGEVFTELLARPGVRIERIVSQGQATPEDAPMVQDADEWVVLLSGTARLRIADAAERALAPGDWLWIPRGTPHWVTWTDPDAPSVWLAVHLD
ncbi:cupin domain-containing protein [Stakelama tenebrarum]|uniref:Cupin domain-containing protein n=1 Tax=Stakelama tenebrarum TaxID=2711215 RepID=A0A6G6Y866_9SPHN|nr:cupin domain-containing protein [Sphingosinithalassobacter tenebrarum]QIG81132.1 cupin domain-containing protein [Sphingosinithalassobacter tenebrarum]